MVLRWLVIWPPGSAFALAVLPWPAFTKVWDTLAAGWPSMARWPYLYTWLAVYFHTHREDLEVSRRPGMISFGDPSLKRNFTEDQACDLFQCLPVRCGIDMFLPPPKLLSWWTKKEADSRQHYESLLASPNCFLTTGPIHFFVEPYCPARFARQFGYCQDLPGDMGITANHRRLALYRSWWPFGKPALFGPCGGLICLRRENGTHLETGDHSSLLYLVDDPHVVTISAKSTGVGAACFLRWRIVTRTMTAIGLTLKRRPRARGQLVLLRRARRGLLLPFWRTLRVLKSKKKKAQTEPPTSCPSENPPIETVQILSSPEAPVAPQEEASVVGELAEITPSEGLPVQEVAPSPSVVQEEAVIEAEALPPAVEEEDPTPAVEVPAIEAAVEVIQEEVPTTEGALETILAPEEADIEVAPAAEEVSLVQATPPTSSSLTPSQTPS
ncbi:hypothetical protein H6P81_018253 [Aristolochia fimbriata]|uniref:Uncharacterized protein n=1 Tax=Aristolochia fimbriata TaxID=158543 RepID=A0AAV7E0T4_ARIFI|nr:hypothetical protein H6P81_018253 [Aristolochia fimbriata]